MFVGVFAFQLIVAVLTVLLGGGKLSLLIILPNIVGGVLLPIVLILTLRLINDKRVMGSSTNSRAFNIIAVITTVVVLALSLTLLIQTVYDNMHPARKLAQELRLRNRNNSSALRVSNTRERPGSD